MKRNLLLTILSTIISLSAIRSQVIKEVQLCNKTNSLYYFSSSSRDIQYFLLKGDTSLLSFIKFTANNPPTTKYLSGLSKQFRDTLKKYNISELPSSTNTKVDLDNNLWHEANFFYIQKSTSKPVQIAQIVILFEGSDAKAESQSPKIKNVVLRTGKKIIPRSKYLTNVEQVKAPPEF